MTNILKIFKRDLKNIFTNWVAAVIVIAIIILPSLYAWFNIKASWDPYSNTGGIKVAVVNEDEGGVFHESEYNIGEKLVDTLKDNDSFGWNFVSKEEADRGVLEGDYYASIEIPVSFTNDILSIASKEIIKPHLIYNVNEKSNAIVPKITNTGVNTVKDELNSSIIKTVNGLIFNVFDKVGITADDYKQTLRNIVDGLYELNDKMPEIENILNEAAEGVITLDDVLNRVKRTMPIVSSTVSQSQTLIKNGQAKVDEVKSIAEERSNEIKGQIIESQQTIENAQNSIKENGGMAIREQLLLIQGQITIIDSKLGDVLNSLNSLKDKLNSINANTDKVEAVIIKIEGLKNQTETILNNVNESIKNIEEGNLDELAIGKILPSINEKINNLQSQITGIITVYDNEVVPAITEAYNSFNNISQDGSYILNVAENTIPDINYLLDLASKNTSLGQEELDKVRAKLPEIKRHLNTLVEKIKEYDDGENFDKLVDLLINNSDDSSTFLSGAINIEKNSIFEVPNYGSAMSPFYTTLALWVGGTILVSLLTTHAKKFEDGEEIKPYEEYFGKGLTFVSIAAIQGLVVTIGDLVLLGTYSLYPVLFVLMGMITSIVFVTFIYTLVSIFGNIGKALAIIFLVLQVAASGGTFPVEVMSDFFQKINPLLPFKYAIGLMRETTAGVVQKLLVSNLLCLSIYFVIAIAMGIGLKKFVNVHTKKFAKKLEESGIAGH